MKSNLVFVFRIKILPTKTTICNISGKLTTTEEEPKNLRIRLCTNVDKRSLRPIFWSIEMLKYDKK